ncbi:MAG: response regulator transcription factor [Treponema sp.]|nr:response regulator transcription factor [Treponema sp.]
MKDKQAVLIVDDEEKILELVKSYLEINGYTALCAKNGREGIAVFEKYQGSQNPVSLILLDLMLPDFPGEEFCRRIREVSDIPIIMITAKADEEDIIRGLKTGADDYVTKPFSPRQLMARVEAALRRTGNSGEKGSCLQYGGLTVDRERRSVSLRNEPLSLTRDEYNILTLLMSRQAKIFTRDEILNSIKGEDNISFDRAVDTHIKNLRAKIGDDPKAPKYIVTVYGMGYRFGEKP